LDDPDPLVKVLHHHWVGRRPVVVELAVDPRSLRKPERCDRPVYELSPVFEFAREQLQFLVWANNYDARTGVPIWWHGRRAARHARASGAVEGGPADIVLADGTALFIDGGPPHPPPLSSTIGVVQRWNAEHGRLRPAGHAGPFSELAPDQLAAVGHMSGPARVIAPAGSGKTRVLTERLRHLLTDRGAHPATVTALAYNSKAARELKARCADIEGSPTLNIRTLNSFGLWICNGSRPSSRLRVLEEPAVRALLESVIKIRHRSNSDTVAPYIAALSSIRLGLTTPSVVEAASPDASGIAEAFDRYRATLADAGAVDFDEQIYLAIEILLTDPEARGAAQARCRHLLVDEFQDLTPAHLLLIRLLCAPGYDCFGVGDDDQVIYGYSGATPEFLINYPDYFPGAVSHALTVNYRCPPAIVAATRHLLSHNVRRVEKEIVTAEGGTDAVVTLDAPSAGAGPLTVREGPPDALASLAIDTIGAWSCSGVHLDDIAVLARVNSALLPVQVACLEAGIPCSLPLSATVLQRTGIRTALAYLRIGWDPGRIRSQDLIETIRRPSRSIAPSVVEMLVRRTSIADVRRLAGRLSGRDGPKLAAYANDIEAVSRACKRTTFAALRAIRVGIGLGENMDVLDASRREPDRSTHADDLAALESVAKLHPEVATFEAWLQEVLSRTPVDGPAVLLSTIHKIKGREWGHVVIFGASAGLIPHRLCNDEEGERRVFHVALTRARTRVVVLADAEAPSIFLAELEGGRVRSSAGQPTGLGGADATGEDRAGSVTRERQRTPGSGHRFVRRNPDTPSAGRFPAVPAVVGLEVQDRGTTGVIAEIGEAAAILSVGAAKLSVPFGTDVRVEGRSVTLVGPSEGAANRAPRSRLAEHTLREWRSAIASREKLPAYVILKDTELAGVAARNPRTLAELATCRGMGQIRLERWGDEILALLDSVREVLDVPHVQR